MKYLIDTHTFLWTLSSSEKLPKITKAKIVDPNNEIYISAVSLWEIAIKTRIKKIDLDKIDIDDLIPLAEKMGMEFISLTPEESLSYGKLDESSHFDSFDRMLIWQSIQRNLTIISKDEEFKKFEKHGLKLLWK